VTELVAAISLNWPRKSPYFPEKVFSITMWSKLPTPPRQMEVKSDCSYKMVWVCNIKGTRYAIGQVLAPQLNAFNERINFSNRIPTLCHIQ